MFGIKITSLEAVKCDDKRRNAESESILLKHNWHWGTKVRVSNGIRDPSSPNRKLWVLEIKKNVFCFLANALNTPPE